MEPLHGGLFDCAVHSFDLTIGPGVFHLGQPVLDPMLSADPVEDVLHREDVALAMGELDAVVGQHGVEPIRNGGDQIEQELRRRYLSSLFDQLGEGELACSVNGDEDVELAFGGLELGDVDVEEPDWVALEPLPFGFVSLDVW